MTFYNKNFGAKGEDIAVNYLLDRGYDLIEKNFRSKFGEIDIVVKKDRKIYFVEVKTRSNVNHGEPYESITPKKIRQLKKASIYYLLCNDYRNYKQSIAIMSIVIKPQQNNKIIFFESLE